MKNTDYSYPWWVAIWIIAAIGLMLIVHFGQ